MYLQDHSSSFSKICLLALSFQVQHKFQLKHKKCAQEYRGVLVVFFLTAAAGFDELFTESIFYRGEKERITK